MRLCIDKESLSIQRIQRLREVKNNVIGKYTVLAAILISAFVLLLAVACGGDAEPEVSPTTAPSSAGDASATPAMASVDEAKISVVSTSNILADWVRVVGGDRVEVFSLLPANADPHTYQPGAQDITSVADADLVFTVGLSLEGGWLDELIENAARDHGAVVSLGDAVDPIDFVEIFEEHEDEEEGHGEARADHEDREEEADGDEHHGDLDPHFWFDPLRAQQAISSIAARLSTEDPTGQVLYRDNAAAYNRDLDGLHSWIEEQVSVLPEDRRVLVTSHDSFQYFAQRYGFDVAGAIFSVTTEKEPTAQDLAALIETIEHEGVPAVFTEKSHSGRLAQRVAEETGAKFIGGLYTGSLGAAGGEAGTYLDLMRYNTTTIVEALR